MWDTERKINHSQKGEVEKKMESYLHTFYGY
jgi:hypothetical protein